MGKKVRRGGILFVKGRYERDILSLGGGRVWEKYRGTGNIVCEREET